MGGGGGGGGGGGVSPSSCQFLSLIFCQFWQFRRVQLTKTEIKVYPVFLTYNIALKAIIGSISTNIDHSHNHKPF